MLPAFRTLLKVLTGRLSREDVRAFTWGDLGLGLAFTWMAGMGRYWDDPLAKELQYLGVGSVIYVFALAFVLWLAGLPMKIERWRYFYVLTFVTLTSPPGLLYAIPVERFTDLHTAMTLNTGFLACVAVWRLFLLFRFFRCYTGLSFLQTFVTGFLPVSVIMFFLALFGLDRTVLRHMAGLPRGEVVEMHANDGSLEAVTLLGILSFYLTPILLIFYLITWTRRRSALAAPHDTGPIAGQ